MRSARNWSFQRIRVAAAAVVMLVGGVLEWYWYYERAHLYVVLALMYLSVSVFLLVAWHATRHTKRKRETGKKSESVFNSNRRKRKPHEPLDLLCVFSLCTEDEKTKREKLSAIYFTRYI